MYHIYHDGYRITNGPVDIPYMKRLLNSKESYIDWSKIESLSLNDSYTYGEFEFVKVKGES